MSLFDAKQLVALSNLAGFMVYDPQAPGYRNGVGTFTRPNVGLVTWRGPVDPRDSNPGEFVDGVDVWIEVEHVGASFDAGALDLLTEPDIRAAWSSARRLRGAYDGLVLEVRESDANTLADVGFDNGGIDQPALLAHVGSHDGLVRRLYDQSGGGRTAAMTTDAQQPAVVDSGTAIELGSRQAIRFGATTSTRLEADAPTLIRDLAGFTVFAVARSTDASGAGRPILRVDGDGNQLFTLRTNGGDWQVGGRRVGSDAFQILTGPAVNTSEDVAIAARIDFIAGEASLWINGVEVAADANWHDGGNSADAAASDVYIGREIGITRQFIGPIGELFVIGSVLSNADMEAVQGDQMTYYEIE
ncbi:LamG-like jellyroll fold domain-containing protein [Phycisphaerales bacterium AB-hyl4]|uniref:LamG-like jellyroll fold domain-containing protein n=1 Tax=Natronomicrosphaera hydrolytica TaxID=3242702 RepID=A0ABV4U6P8_9BACT